MRTFEQILNDCIALQKAKNSKYKRGSDPLSGFIAAAEGSQAKSVSHHIYGRFLEKDGRIRSYYEEDKLNVDGLVEELEDNINYCAFQIMALERLQEEQPVRIDPFIKRRTGG